MIVFIAESSIVAQGTYIFIQKSFKLRISIIMLLRTILCLLHVWHVLEGSGAMFCSSFIPLQCCYGTNSTSSVLVLYCNYICA